VSRRDLGYRAIFGVPILVGVLSLIGLVGALLEDGAWDWIGVALLGVSVAVISWALLRRRPGSERFRDRGERG